MSGSTKMEKVGKCGKSIKIALWKRGGNIKCHLQGLTTYPQPDSVTGLIDYFCEECPEALK